MNNLPLVSVIIPNYNYGRFLARCVESVLLQTYSNIECIIVDDGSTDNSIEIIESLCNKYDKLIVVQKSNGGLSRARNSGIEKSKGEYLCFLDSDDFWGPKKIENQMKIALDGFHCVFSGFQLINESNQIVPSKETHTQNLSIYDFIEGNPISGSSSSILIRRSCITNNMYFNEKRTSLEDLDLWYRLFINGYKFQYCFAKDVFISSRSTGENMSSDYENMFFNHLTLLIDQLKHLTEKEKRTFKFKKSIYKRLTLIGWYANRTESNELNGIVKFLINFYCGNFVRFLFNHRIQGIIKKFHF